MTDYPILFNAPEVRANRAGIKTQARRTRGLGKINEDPTAWELIGHARELIGQGDPGLFIFEHAVDANCHIAIRCPYGGAGDRLWVREMWKPCRWDEGGPWRFEYADGLQMEETSCAPKYEDWSEVLAGRCQAELDALIAMGNKSVSLDGERYSWTGMNPLKWRPSIHMPRWASRDTLEVISARPERLQCITENDVMAEGIRCIFHGREGWFYHHERTESHPHNWVSPLDAYRELWDSTSKDLPFAKNPFVWRIEYRRIA